MRRPYSPVRKLSLVGGRGSDGGPDDGYGRSRDSGESLVPVIERSTSAAVGSVSLPGRMGSSVL